MKPMRISKYVEKNHKELSDNEILKMLKDKDFNKNALAKSLLALALNVSKSFNLSTGKPIEELFPEALVAINDALTNFKLDDHNKTIGNIKVHLFVYVKTAIQNKLSLTQNNIIKKPRNTKDETKAIPYAQIFDEMYNDLDEQKEFDVDDPIHTIKLMKLVLKPKEVAIVVDRLGLSGNTKTLKEIAQENNLTSERIRQIYNKSLLKLKSNKQLIDRLNDLKNLTII